VELLGMRDRRGTIGDELCRKLGDGVKKAA